MTVLIPLLVVVILFCEPRLRELLASEENEYFTEMQLKRRDSTKFGRKKIIPFTFIK